MDVADELFALACIALGVVAALIAGARSRRARRLSRLGTVGHLLHGPYRASDARLFITVDGKTTELKRVRQMISPNSGRPGGEHPAAGAGASTMPAVNWLGADVDGVRW